MLALFLSTFALASPDLTMSGDEQGERGWSEDEWSGELPWDDDAYAPSVVGGEPVQHGVDRWDSTVGIVVRNSYVSCTGTLIAPRVVLTAAHCLNGVTGVIVGAKDWARDSSEPETEIIRAEGVFPHPSYNRGAGPDIAVLLLEEPSSYPPTPIGTDCVRDEDLVDGVEAAVVGFGNTRYDGRGGTSQLHAGMTAIQDRDCVNDRIDGIWTGCLPSLRPGGELAAGGNGVDACFGDSGGPLYLPTQRGDFVVGVVSRAFAGVPQNEPCLHGGIYVRPDAFIDWMEEVTGELVEHPQCNEPPVASADGIRARPGRSGTTQITAVDPDGDDDLITYEVLVRPEHGLASVSPDGEVTYVANEDYRGEDSFVIGVVDSGSDVYERSGPATTPVEIPVTVGRSFLGCSATAAAPTGLAALFGGFFLLLRRRRAQG